MSDRSHKQGSWRRRAGLALSALVLLGGLAALRGPDEIGVRLADTVGTWHLSGGGIWQPGAPTAALASLAFRAAGPRGWQNLHVIVPWLAVLCWLWGLPRMSWRGLMPLVPASLALVLGDAQSGLSGFGLGVLTLSAWRAVNLGQPSGAWLTFAPAAWLAVWFSPGCLPVVAAFALEFFQGRPRKQVLAGTSLALLAVHLTPAGSGVWDACRVFLFWSPQAALGGAAVAAVMASLCVLALAVHGALHRGEWGPVAGVCVLLPASLHGQTAYLWPAGLLMFPCWRIAGDTVWEAGIRMRWFVRFGLLMCVAGLLLSASSAAFPRWFDLAMTPAAIMPTLTRPAPGFEGPVYINPAGLPLARFAGKLPARTADAGEPRLAREPSLWRARDRAERFRAVWLLGEKSEYAPLARHLGQSPDWQLAAVDACGVLFLRQRREDEFATEPAQEFAREQGAAANRSAFLAGASLSCLAANALPEAVELSRMAVRQSQDSVRAAWVRARALTSAGDIREALAQSERALVLDPRAAEAWQTRAETLLHAGQIDDAYAAAQRGMELAPGDAGALWLAARAANAARAFQSESETLERLIALTEGRGGDAAFYQFYLGQAYARQGLARPALRALRAALAAPGLGEDQRREIEEAIRNLEPPGSR